MKVFLAFSFRDDDRLIVTYIERLLASQYVHVITGERLGGEKINDKVKERIKGADALVGLLTRRDQLAKNDEWTTHDWVKDEIQYAREEKRRVIALIEDGVKVGGMSESHEYIQFTKEKLLEAMLILSENISQWKSEAGRTVKVQIMPDDVAQKLGGIKEKIKCEHRFFMNGRYTEWRDSLPIPEIGGTFIYLEGVREEQLVQIRVEDLDNHYIWSSPAISPQSLQIWLKNEGKNS